MHELLLFQCGRDGDAACQGLLSLNEYCPVSNKCILFKQFAFLWLKQNKKQIVKYVLCDWFWRKVVCRRPKVVF